MGHKKITDINTELMAGQLLPDGRRKLRLNNAERKDLQRNRMIEHIVAMFLDIDNNHTRAEICEELGINQKRLKDITLSDEFQEIYAQYRVELGHDPRLQAAQIELSDMVPQAIRTLKSLINAERVPASTKLEAVKTILKLGGLQEPKPVKTEKAEVMDFLREAGINIEQVNVHLPAELKKANQFITVVPKEVPEDQ